MDYLSLDLEMNKPSGKIIQIGAAIGNILTGEVKEKFSRIVKIDEVLDPFIVGLTGISDEMISNGVSLEQAYIDLCELKKRHDCQTNPITWGGGDSLELKKQLGEAGVCLESWPFGRRWIDIKTVYQVFCLSRGIKIHSGLAKSMTRVGLNFVGRKHNALDDALNTLTLANRLINEMKQIQRT